MLPSEELLTIKKTLEYIAILLFKKAAELDSRGQPNRALLTRAIGGTISKILPLGVYNWIHGGSVRKVQALIDKAEKGEG